MANNYDILNSLGMSEDDPLLVFWKKHLSPNDGDEWLPLDDHACNGFCIDDFDGFVIGLRPADTILPLIKAIAEEDFCLKATSRLDYLDYGVKDPQRQAYKEYLLTNDLEPGSLELLKQAVYPLAATKENLHKLGVSISEIPEGASVVILGWNCD